MTPRAALSGGLVCLVFLAARSFAHSPGLSWVEFKRASDGHVDALFVFAASDSIGPVVLPRDRNGVVDENSVESKTGELAALVTDSVVLKADNEPCPATFQGATLTEEDGLAVSARYDCPRDVGRIEATLFYLNRMSHGHRQLVRFTAGESGEIDVQRVLGNTRRAIAIDLPRAALNRSSYP